MRRRFIFILFLMLVASACTSKEITYPECSDDKDCILILVGCPICGDCMQHSISDDDVVAIPISNYDCPSRPKGTVCVACETIYDFERNEAICREGRCTKP